ncbi:PTS transporter subunit EIIC [Enterococcus cecorum]|uniref:PTS sugar transporter subunit IIC n=1 Tax=Enterococcus cecorum TaxID=44008 RepID=UPI0032C3E8EA
MQTKNSKFQNFLDKFTEVSVKVGNQVHLRSLRDAFATIMPMFILAGLAVLVNNVIFPWFLKGDMLAKFQVFGNVITNGTLNIASILIAPMIAYFLSRNKNYENPIAATAIATSGLFIMMAMNHTVTALDGKTTVDVAGIVTYTELGTQGMFAGIIVGLLATEVFMKLTKVKFLQINFGKQVPPAVGKSFSVLLPAMITLSGLAVISALFISVLNTDLITIISTMIQEPLRKVNTSLPGYLLIYSTGNFLFTLGIHQTVINGSLLDPLMLVNMNENMSAVNNGQAPQHIINSAFQTVYAQMGGTGGTIALIVAVLLFVKYKPYRDVIGLSVAPGLFEINEPIIFGLPIVFNIPMMIPFVLSPVIGAIIGYFATAVGFVQPLTVMVPWTTPPILSGILASGGDFKVALLQVIIIAVTALFYLPFLKISERVSRAQAEALNQ